MSQGERDKPTGQFTPDMGAMCVCGHPLALHTASGPVRLRECIAHDLNPIVELERYDEPCGCEGFRRSFRKPK